MVRYAQLDKSNTVIGISELSGEVVNENMILINDRPDVNIGWQYIDGEWTETEHALEPSTPEISNAEVIQSIEDLKIDLLIAGVIDVV